ncbi:MAG TPA: hypothetical protein ENK18_06730 [Deltaproteobacteria bacterium]|nr:hypothetical protein [Deltaproteobacteria bacterium]
MGSGTEPLAQGGPEEWVRSVPFTVCPFVQRAVSTLEEKGVAHEVEHIELQDEPGWFLALSPRGRVPPGVSSEGLPARSPSIHQPHIGKETLALGNHMAHGVCRCTFALAAAPHPPGSNPPGGGQLEAPGRDRSGAPRRHGAAPRCLPGLHGAR